METLGLLKTVQPCEYPAEFLAARLRGKKGGLFRNWEVLLSGGSVVARLQNTPFYPYLQKHGSVGAWRFLHHEHLWVHKRMNQRLRTLFEPYFAWHELNTLVVCLRHLAGGRETGPVSAVLQDSLLHDYLQKILCGSGSFSDKLSLLETFLNSSTTAYTGMQAEHEKNGMQGLEIFLRSRFWDAVLSRKQPTVLKTFSRFLVDFHNAMILAKSIRWNIETEPPLLKGGAVPLERLGKAYRMRDLAPVLQSLRLRNAGEGSPTGANLESLLLQSIGTRLKKFSYQRTETGEILFYLWEQYRYSRNISFILNSAFLNDKRLQEGLVT